MLKLNKDYFLTVFLLIGIIILIFLSSSKGVETRFYIENTNNIVFDKSTNTLQLNSLTLKQKIAQIIITYGKEEDKKTLQEMFIGGIYLGAKPSKEDFVNTINYFQEEAIIPFFVGVDMEGCFNPFENFQEFLSLRDIKTKQDAYKVGYEQGKLLKEIGFSINFAPVVDLEDNIWKCRNFVGNPLEISDKANAYINGLQSNNIIAVSKHYPGKTLVIRDPHRYIVYAEIKEDDLLPFKETIKNNVSAVMVSHIIVNGSVDSELKPSVVSKNLINSLREKFNGLIITDEIGMLGLRDYYSNVNEMYIDLFKVDNDIILNFDTNLKNIYYMINVIEKAVKRGEVSEERINKSVTRILKAKGINVI